MVEKCAAMRCTIMHVHIIYVTWFLFWAHQPSKSAEQVDHRTIGLLRFVVAVKNSFCANWVIFRYRWEKKLGYGHFIHSRCRGIKFNYSDYRDLITEFWKPVYCVCFCSGLTVFDNFVKNLRCLISIGHGHLMSQVHQRPLMF